VRQAADQAVQRTLTKAAQPARAAVQQHNWRQPNKALGPRVQALSTTMQRNRAAGLSTDAQLTRLGGRPLQPRVATAALAHLPLAQRTAWYSRWGPGFVPSYAHLLWYGSPFIGLGVGWWPFYSTLSAAWILADASEWLLMSALWAAQTPLPLALALSARGLWTSTVLRHRLGVTNVALLALLEAGAGPWAYASANLGGYWGYPALGLGQGQGLWHPGPAVSVFAGYPGVLTAEALAFDALVTGLALAPAAAAVALI
jgi:hypothetical protein